MSHAYVRFLASLIFATTACLQTIADDHKSSPDRPNILFLLVDDMGWADVGFNGATFHETPAIDALAASGMVFKNGYAACPVCSPTRASILTGRHPVRVDITDWIPGRKTPANARFAHVHDRDNLALKEVTMAEAFKEHGYQTFFAGKWHLGDKGHYPTDQGFDINIGGHHRGSPPGGYYTPWKNPVLDAKPDAKDEYLTERLTDETSAFIEARDPKKPFFAYLSYYNIHTPIQPYKKAIDHFTAKAKALGPAPDPIAERDALSRPRQDNAALASMTAAIDNSVRDLMACLKTEGLADNTIVCFFSDNGGLCTKAKPGPGCNLPLRSGKGWLYEGGVREPMIIRAPGVTTAGSVTDIPVVSMDFFPTLLQLAGVPLQPDNHADGQSLVPLLKSPTTDDALARLADHPLHWHYPHYHGSNWRPGAAIRHRNWKLIEHYDHRDTELFDLAADPGEQRNLAAEHPNVTARLQRDLADWQTTIKAKMPTPK